MGIYSWHEYIYEHIIVMVFKNWPKQFRLLLGTIIVNTNLEGKDALFAIWKFRLRVQQPTSSITVH